MKYAWRERTRKKIPAEPDRNPLDSDQNLQWEKCNEARRKLL